MILLSNTTYKAFVVPIIYVNDILSTSSDKALISNTKAYLQTHFLMHDV